MNILELNKISKQNKNIIADGAGVYQIGRELVALDLSGESYTHYTLNYQLIDTEFIAKINIPKMPPAAKLASDLIIGGQIKLKSGASFTISSEQLEPGGIAENAIGEETLAQYQRYQELTKINNPAGVQVDARQFIAALKSAASHTEAYNKNNILSCLNFQISAGSDKLQVNATDGNRLIQVYIPVITPPAADIEINIKHADIKNLINFLNPEQLILIEAGKSGVFRSAWCISTVANARPGEGHSLRIAGVSYEGNYPRVNQFITERAKEARFIETTPEAMLAGIKAIKGAANTTTYKISLTPTGELIASSESGEARYQLPGVDSYGGSDKPVYFNLKYMQAAIESIKNLREVKIQIAYNGLEPIKIYGHSHKTLVMPIKCD